jgi:hypothetical protein
MSIKNWNDYRAQLVEGLDADKRKQKIVESVIDTCHADYVGTSDDFNRLLLDQQEVNESLTESTSAGSTVTSNISRYDTMFLPMIRRTMPQLLAMDLVGVQPMSTPRGIVRTIRTRYSETTANGGPTAGTEASGQEVFEKYSKIGMGQDYDAVDSLNPFQQTVHMEGRRGKPMDLEVVTKSVEPMSRKLSAAYSLEAEDDLNALDGLDLESEITQAVGDEILRELDRELIDELNDLAGIVDAFDFANVDGRYAGEKLAALSIAVDDLSDRIAVATKKGGATWMVISPRVFTALKNAANSKFVPANGGDLSISTSLFVGTMGGRVKVYVDPYASGDTVLLGYKGSSDIDTGLIYSPYIPLSSSGVVTNPETFDKRLQLRTRYGLTSFTDSADSLADSPDYYARATIANLELGFRN